MGSVVAQPGEIVALTSQIATIKDMNLKLSKAILRMAKEKGKGNFKTGTGK